MPNALAVFVGVALVILAAVWRERSRRHLQSRVAAGLASTDPAVRAVALRVIGSGGLRRWSTILVHRIDAGLDDEMATELAWLVVTNQWEPADEPKLLRLRQWAADYLEHGQTAAPATEVVARSVVDQAADRARSSALASSPSTPAPVVDATVPKPPLVAASEAALGARVLWLRYTPGAALAPTTVPKPALVAAIENALGVSVVWLRFVAAEGQTLPAVEPAPPDRPALVATVEDALEASVRWLRYLPAPPDLTPAGAS